MMIKASQPLVVGRFSAMSSGIMVNPYHCQSLCSAHATTMNTKPAKMKTIQSGLSFQAMQLPNRKALAARVQQEVTMMVFIN